MHIRKEPSFFVTNNTGAPYGEELGSIRPFFSNSVTWFSTSASSTGLSL